MEDGLRSLEKFVSRIRQEDATIQIQVVATLLEVADNEGMSVTDIARKVGSALSSTSRNLAALSDRHWQKTKSGQPKPGLGLVELRIDPMNSRSKQVFLTSKGKQLLNEALENRKEN